ncbi:hypothetical protein Bbelb_398290 [Branchiostoma belcheri]|nr:hypothetical protein Bbelb_398290 [Branchiostoma belcheri]
MEIQNTFTVDPFTASQAMLSTNKNILTSKRQNITFFAQVTMKEYIPDTTVTRHSDIIFGKSKAVVYGKKESVWLTRMVFIHPTIERANDFERDLRQKYGIIAPVEEFVAEAVPTFADVYERNDLVDY